jgi:hypothetical protein
MEEPISSVTQPRCEVHRDKELQSPRQDRFIWPGLDLQIRAGAGWLHDTFKIDLNEFRVCKRVQEFLRAIRRAPHLLRELLFWLVPFIALLLFLCLLIDLFHLIAESMVVRRKRPDRKIAHG